PARSAAYNRPVYPGKRVSAIQTTIPAKTNGIAISVNASAVSAISRSGLTGIRNCKMKQTTLVKANANADRSRETNGSRFFMTSTSTAPAARPNIAREMAMKAKWYHIVTLKMRVRNNSSWSNDNVVRNRPIYVEGVGRTKWSGVTPA